MKKLLILLLILLAAFFMHGKLSVNDLVKKAYGKDMLVPKRVYWHSSIKESQNILGCMTFLVNEKKTESEQLVDRQDEPENNELIEDVKIDDQKPGNNGNSTMGNKPTPSTPSKPAKVCKKVYVIDSFEQKEEGHYQVIHHPEVTKTERKYKEYVEYVFYRDDDSKYIYKDYDKTFSADSYLNNHSDEYSRYTFSKKYEESKVTVVVSEAYDEEVWVVDVPYKPQKGHYEEICE